MATGKDTQQYGNLIQVLLWHIMINRVACIWDPLSTSNAETHGGGSLPFQREDERQLQRVGNATGSIDQYTTPPDPVPRGIQ